MIMYRASVLHSEASVRGFTRAQFLLFQDRKRFLILLTGAGLLILGAALAARRGLSLTLMFAGCLILMDLPYISRRTASLILKHPENLFRAEYEFGEQSIKVQVEENQAETAYSKLCRLAEDRSFFYLFLNSGKAYTIDKESLVPKDDEAFHAFLKQQTGLLWEQVYGTAWFRLRRAAR